MTVWMLAPPLPRRQLVAQLAEAVAQAGLPAPTRAYRVGAYRWAAAWPAHRLVVALAGGRYRDGRLVRGLSGTHDYAKVNAATLAGGRVLRFTPQQVADGAAVAQIAAALGTAQR